MVPESASAPMTPRGGLEHQAEQSFMRNVEILIVALFVAATLALWSHALRRRWAGEAMLSREPAKLVRWGLIDFLLAFFLYFSLTAVVSPLVLEYFFGFPRGKDILALTADERTLMLWGTACGGLLAFVASSLLVRGLHHCSWQDLGWVRKRWRSDLKLGVVAFVMLAPPVYALQILLTQFFESKHPLIEAIKDNATLPLVVASGAVAVIAAPIVEEYLLRVLLQGWLEKLAASHDDPVRLLVGEGRGASSPPDDVDLTAKEQPATGCEPTESSPLQTPHGSQAMWPVLVSSLVFAVMHFAHGPDWIPLFVLALGLGYLYRQTHRILPCIVVHFLLNACSFTVFISSLEIK
jgi:membrane protease YdiL (CAAX protease family)